MMLESRRLLVVDDEEPNRDLLSRRLRKAGFDVECAASGKEALEVLKREAIDLVLLDNMMPEMSGLDLLRLLRATQSASELPVIMVTALHDSSRVVEALSTGANDYVTKPIDFPVALARVEALLQRRRAELTVRKNEERLTLAASGANEGLFDLNLETGALFVSERWQELAGVRSWDKARAESWLEQLHPKDAEQMKQFLSRCAQSECEDRVEMEQRMRQADGTCRWIHVKAALQKNEQGMGRRLVGSISDITLTKAYDPLTALGNRNLLLHRIEEFGVGSSILLLSLDRFKIVHDNLGPGAGAKLIAEAARRLEAVLGSLEGEEPVLARLEAEQFGVLLGPRWSDCEVEALAKRLIAVTEEPMLVEGKSLFTSANVGFARMDEPQMDSERGLMDAMTALGQAKVGGRGRVVRFEATLRGRAIEQMELENDLRTALDRGEFMVYYQPKIELSSGRIRGFEALLRWKHPSKGMVPPDVFIPIAEQGGMMIPLGHWVLRMACQTAKRWRDQFPDLEDLVVSVNVSAYQVKDGNMVERVEEVLAETGLEAKALHLEVTESAFLADTMETIRVFDQLKALGVELNLDDFGTGYSSLQYLSDMKFDTLKIDKSFLKNLLVDEQASELVRSMLGMAKSLDMEVVAEGVETQGQLDHLRDMGCKYGQGYLFSRPVPEEQVLEILRRESVAAAS